MADHYLKSIEYLDELDAARKELAQLYAEPKVPSGPGLPFRRPDHIQKRINSLNPKIGHLLKLADIHATLSVRQALQDQAADRDHVMTFGKVGS